MELEVRKYQSTDFKEVWEVHVKAVMAAGFPRNVAESDFDHDIVLEYLDNGGEFLVAKVSNRIVGMGGLKRIGSRSGELTRMRVHPDFQRMGIGTKILFHLESSAKKLGIGKLRLDTANHGVRGFYEQHGYRFIKTKVDGDYEYLFFEKNLAML